MTDSESSSADARVAEEVARDAAEAKNTALEILKQSVEDAKAQSAERYDRLVRLTAEFDNYRRRSERERAEARRWGKEEIILRLVALMDVMEQAEASAHGAADLKAVVAGLDMLYGEFKRLLKDEGLEEVTVVPGEAYRHDDQEAVDAVEDEGEPDRVLAVLQKGYRFQGALLRPARVRISKAKKAATTKSSEQGG